MSQKIVPHIWFKDAFSAAKFYCSIFPNAELSGSATLQNSANGNCDLVSFKLNGYEFYGISSASAKMEINPSISFMLNFNSANDSEAERKLDELWSSLLSDALVRMPLGEYPFSKKYGWLEDKHGVSWQFLLTDENGKDRPFVRPALLFVNEQYGNAEAATDLYISAFHNAKRGLLVRYPAGMPNDRENTIMFTDCALNDQWFTAMDSGAEHAFAFNEAVSFLVKCDTQEDVDHFYNTLSAKPENESCGWIKDLYGVSWQISMNGMVDMFLGGSRQQIDDLFAAFLPMKRIDVSKLREAYEQSGQATKI